jgi:hypothetical protein
VTIAVSLKVNDGLVLAADSASTIASGGGVENVYNNANKVYNLMKGLPIGLVTWGLGGLAGLSISTLAKDLRLRFAGKDPAHKDWHLDGESYTIKEVAERVKTFFYVEHYAPAAQDYEQQKGADDDPYPSLGFIVAGYSAGEPHAEEYLLHLTPDGCEDPAPVRTPDETGASWAGQPEALTRIMNGHGTMLGDVLQADFGLDAADVPDAVALIAQRLDSPLVNPAMPFQDAIELAEWLVGLSIGYARFMPGAPIVGGPIETAAISKHEGFKWVRRKHYFDARLNPEVGHEGQ